MLRIIRLAFRGATVAVVLAAVAALAPHLGGGSALRAQVAGIGGSFTGFSGDFGSLCGFNGFSFGACSFGGFGGTFSGDFGSFAVSTPQASVAVWEEAPLIFAWLVPPQDGWRDLDRMHVRLRSGDTVAVWVEWQEATNTFALLDPATGDVQGIRRAAGQGAYLNTRYAWVDLQGTGVAESGPGGDTVALLLPVSFKPPSAGRTFLVEVGAADDRGQVMDYQVAGTLTVQAK